MNLSHHRVIKEGDLVILYERKDSLIPITVTKGEKYSCILGAFIHDQMIGKEYGCLVGHSLYSVPYRLHHKQVISICMRWSLHQNYGLHV